ncbi:MAG: hypothetical protein JM58_12340 [Peptococcaceae bacterium BICA1-8]|nr:MAG: hypothetical protein JM58_12340 [Peptococcaceae bacterium BICA1-8]
MAEILEELSEVIKGCSRCGFCMVECPAYGATKIEWDVARGRIRLANELLNGNMAFDGELDDPVDTCLMCRSCYDNCSSKIDTPKAVQLIRTLRYKSGKMKLPYRMVFERVLPNKGLMSLGTRLMSSAQGIGLDKLMNSKIIVRLFPEAEAIADVVPKLPKKRARKVLPHIIKPDGPAKGKVIYFLGCAVDFAYPDVAQATVQLLAAQGIEVHVPEVSCCGLPAYTYGHVKAAQDMAKLNLEKLKIDEFDAVISDCSTCASFLKEYTDFIKDENIKEQAHVLAEKVYDVSEYLAKIELQGPRKVLNKTVTYHQSCHLGRYLGKTKEIENILDKLPGITFIKADNQNECCGGAGSYCITQQKRSQKILDKKVEGISKTKADYLITSCPACMLQLNSGLKKSETNTQVLHLTELLKEIYLSDMKK